MASEKAAAEFPLEKVLKHIQEAQLQKAAKLLDTGAVWATKFLWQYPTARVILFFYLEQADTCASREVAESVGLGNRTLP
ncbi:hypothetical protein ACH5RR_006042 [Cinchona calisaya]|uniref:Uncharacterized protein n=1 Tax=Cinchona calisaya TaxID=153742 RepID=A0ABD3AN65_9GENT